MLRLRKIGLLLMLWGLVFTLFPQNMAAENIQNHEVEYVVSNPNVGEPVPLFNDLERTESNLEIPDGSIVQLIEEHEEVSLIQFTTEDHSENSVHTGYIQSTYLTRALDEEKQEPIREESQESIKEENHLNDGETTTDSSASENESEEHEEGETEESIEKDNSDTSNENARLRGIALKSKTNVYSSKSNESMILKSYSQGHILIFEKDDSEWYSATVYVAGEGRTGYIHVDDVDLIIPSERSDGFALKQPVSIFASPSESAKVLKTYNRGSKLIFNSFSSKWHQVTVYVNGKAETGYLLASDVGPEEVKVENFKGIALKNPTIIYGDTSRKSESLKTYNPGHILKYQSYNSEWYTATVYISGKPHVGFIHVDDVENEISNPTSVTGIALKNSTNIYSSASTGSAVLKRYKQGHILKYRTFTQNWYEATVYVNGKARTGYIHRNDVETAETSQTSLQGFGVKNPTKIYASASTGSTVLKTYKQGHLLKYRSFTKDWYEATVYVNGKARTGYIYVNDVETPTNSQTSLEGIGVKNPTRVYSSPTSNSKVLKSYRQGQVLKYRTFITNWYEATVYVNGKAHKGYIHHSDVENIQKSNTTLRGFGIKSPTKVYSMASSNSKVLKDYQNGTMLQYRPYTASWYEATVYVNGKPQTGYIYNGDVDDRSNYKISAFEQEVIDLVNKERIAHGLEPLEIDIDVNILARAKSRDMAVNSYFAHTSPTYGSPSEMANAFGIPYSLGENIAWGYNSPQSVMYGWMNSPGHRNNILHPHYTHIGVGHYNSYWTQQFTRK